MEDELGRCEKERDRERIKRTKKIRGRTKKREREKI